jgi:hypothetical protein
MAYSGAWTEEGALVADVRAAAMEFAATMTAAE